MADVTVTYNGNTIAEMSATGSKTLETAGKYVPGNIGIAYAKQEGIPYNIPKVDDNNAHIHVYLDNDSLTITVYVRATNAQEFTVDWGDGSSVETKSNVSSITHTYSVVGYYHIKLVKTVGDPLLGNAGNYWLIGGSSYPERADIRVIIGLETGTWGIASLEFLNNSNVEVIYAKKASTLTYSRVMARACHALHTLELPTTPNIVIGTYCYESCFGLSDVVIPANVSTIEGYAFMSCGKISIHMLATTPPTLNATTAFNGCDVTIYVPNASVETYKAAATWSSFADNIVGE